MRLAYFTLLSPFVFSCSLIYPANQVQCDTDEECEARGFSDSRCEAQVCVAPPDDPVWGCLGNIDEPVLTPGAMHSVAFEFVDALTSAPPTALQVRLCTQLDLACTSPVMVDIPFDATGHGSISVDSGFQGYFEVTSESTVPAILPIGPVVADVPSFEPVQLVADFIVESIASAAGYTLDPSKGTVLMLLSGCDGSGRAGVSFAAETEGDPFYLYGLSPDPTALESDASGQGGFINLEPGFVTLTTTRFETGEFIARQRVLIRAGTITYRPMLPTPS